MWVLDPANSSELLHRLRPHSLDPQFEVIWCGEGWRSLVSDCDDQLRLAFPDYRFTHIEQEHGELVVAAQPRAGEFSEPEQELVDDVTRRCREQSRMVCEWCGRDGSTRRLSDARGRQEAVTVCDQCQEDLQTLPYPTSRPVN